MQEKEILEDYRADWVRRSLRIPGLDYKLLEGRSVIWIYNKEDELTMAMDEILNRIGTEKGIRFEHYAVDISVPEEGKKCIPYDRISRPVMLVWDISGHELSAEKSGMIMEFAGDILYVHDKNIDTPITDKIRYLSCPGIIGAGYFGSQDSEEKNISTAVLDFLGHQIYLLAHLQDMEPGTYGKSETQIIYEDKYNNLITSEDNIYMYNFWKNYPEDIFYFDNTYNGDLKLLQQLLYMCLAEFDRICREQNINYFLGGGSLLGAVRDHGIIPWDDDVDVMMLRDDYERFIAAAPKAVRQGIFFQSSKTDKEYHSVFPKLRIDGTRFVTEFSSRFANMHQGIFIDIFVHDHTADNRLLQKMHIYETLFARSMVFHKWEGTPMHFYGKLKLICKLATRYIKRTSMEKLERHQDRVIRKYNARNTEYLYDGTGEHLRHGAFPACWLAEARYVPFGDREYPIPAEAEKYLEYSYGADYMQWIPASERKGGHHIIEVDFGEYKL